MLSKPSMMCRGKSTPTTHQAFHVSGGVGFVLMTRTVVGARTCSSAMAGPATAQSAQLGAVRALCVMCCVCV